MDKDYAIVDIRDYLKIVDPNYSTLQTSLMMAPGGGARNGIQEASTGMYSQTLDGHLQASAGRVLSPNLFSPAASLTTTSASTRPATTGRVVYVDSATGRVSSLASYS